MSIKTVREALNEAFAEEMERDKMCIRDRYHSGFQQCLYAGPAGSMPYS